MVCRGIALLPAFQSTVDPAVKLVPVTLSEREPLPATAVVELSEVIVGRFELMVNGRTAEDAPPGFRTLT